jgi:hypothetical protein
MEVEQLCEIGVLKKVNHSEWGAPTFTIPKKDQSVRFITNFQELNKRIKRKPFHIPKIQDLLLTEARRLYVCFKSGLKYGVLPY